MLFFIGSTDGQERPSPPPSLPPSPVTWLSLPSSPSLSRLSLLFLSPLPHHPAVPSLLASSSPSITWLSLLPFPSYLSPSLAAPGSLASMFPGCSAPADSPGG
ncbi:hypothetical protein E2C01_015278 [Portunus trituberculatus]|uniref:Uncharacterized protein n=1 Tax=Portunus trituberculatus TaxID=210409 RepID=A0A5B7DMB1_PORTR|nr:hypothetical protein [Portunus trituberculatus]